MIRPHHWLIALLVALAAHLLTFAVLAYTKPVGDAADQGAQGIEIDLGMLGDLGAAQETEQPKEIAPPKPQVAPPPPPEPPPAPPRQQAVAQVKTPPKPKPEPVREAVPEEVKQDVSAPTAVETGQSNTDTNELKQSTGTGNATTAGGTSSATKSYYSMLAAKLARYKRYPSASRRRNEQGTPVLYFVVGRDGSVSQASIRTSSGFERLDQAVLDMLKRATPLPEFTDDMTEQQLPITIPVEFKLTDRR
ncbi:protein TonB [Halopseudomonas sabulinigri]|uniref:Protein TonB n=1 Tax=Halopseudomonas sabulinigri TaxID=472181 RepID=A0A1H1RHS8_9GAMM|nr:energy transducer TonB [Halopseudomonas sabulinigri]SDS35252.1 protein TonB [Halopseudomonas sabulinigri]